MNSKFQRVFNDHKYKHFHLTKSIKNVQIPITVSALNFTLCFSLLCQNNVFYFLKWLREIFLIFSMNLRVDLSCCILQLVFYSVSLGLFLSNVLQGPSFRMYPLAVLSQCIQNHHFKMYPRAFLSQYFLQPFFHNVIHSYSFTVCSGVVLS